MPRKETVADAQLTDLRAARGPVRRTLIELARSAGTQIIERPIYPGAPTSIIDIEPLAGIQASRQVALGARHAARGHMREAREAGRSWRQIGKALGLTLGADPYQAGNTIAESAYTYTRGSPDIEAAFRYGRPVAWTWQSCDRAISERGLCNGPADDEDGHANGCLRLSASVAAWDAKWEAGQ